MIDFITERLHTEIHAGAICIDRDSDKLFALINDRFPIGINRIAWENVGRKWHIEVGRPADSSIVSSYEIESRLSNYREILKGWLSENGIAEQVEVFWCGDSTDVGLKMSLRTLLESFPILFSFPQHAYVIPSDAAWCINYTMEDVLYFGFGAKPKEQPPTSQP